jgi:hypothetical protein
MSTIHPLTTITPAIPVTAYAGTREERQHQELQLHQIIRATVAEGGQDRVLLEMGQQRVPAQTSLPLKAGQALELQVVALSPQLQLQVVSDPLTARLGQVLHLLGGKWEFLPPLRALVAAAETEGEELSSGAREALQVWLGLQGEVVEQKGPEALRQLLLRLGLDLEAMLARREGKGDGTLKAALLEVMARGGGEGREHASQLVQTLELFQLAQVRLDQQGALLLPLPLPFLEQGFLVAEGGGEGAEGQADPQRLALHLALQGLGNLRVDFYQSEEGLLLRFACEGREQADFLAGFQEELRSALEQLPLTGLSFTTGVESPDKALIRRLLPEGQSVLDTRV